ncbi:RNA polymerase sigma factor [Ulvibacterium sp.]|uniref:RNA polymerase sigma factor n=1 Tax=Ulvibacterium sp. TaxID=2665914 RepID=UPI003BAC73E7
MGEPKREQLVEHVFRHEHGKMVSFLVHKFGPSHLERIEDAVQESLIKAMDLWGYNDPPNNPTSWLLRVANNMLIDTLRRETKMDQKEDISIFERQHAVQEEVLLNDRINDSQLKMIFACCHPSLSKEYQIILSLKLIGGFGNKEIARALLKKEDAIAKSFTRAKKKLKEHVKTLNSPVEIGLRSRLTIVLKVIYLLFTEGYTASHGEILIKKDICLEAIRLALLLCENKYCNQPEVHALIALMCFHTSRFEARIDQNGDMVDLEHQDRKTYDKDLIRIGIEHLEEAAVDSSPSDYHLQAAVAYYHCTAVKFEDTDWKGILRLYDLQLERQYSPIVWLNRIVPYYKVYGARKALLELQNFENGPYFSTSALFYAIKAQLLHDQGISGSAREALQKAIDLTTNLLEKKHLSKKLNTY